MAERVTVHVDLSWLHNLGEWLLRLDQDGRLPSSALSAHEVVLGQLLHPIVADLDLGSLLDWLLRVPVLHHLLRVFLDEVRPDGVADVPEELPIRVLPAVDLICRQVGTEVKVCHHVGVGVLDGELCPVLFHVGGLDCARIVGLLLLGQDLLQEPELAVLECREVELDCSRERWIRSQRRKYLPCIVK